MRSWLASALAAVAIAAFGPASPGGTAQGSLARVTAQTVPEDLRVHYATLSDVNGDGRVDLVVSAGHREQPLVRSLHVFYDQGGNGGGWKGFGAEQRLDLTVDVVAWAVGDVHADAGLELVLLTARGAFAWRPKAPEEERFQRLVEAEFLWQLADPEQAFPFFHALQDVDADGLVDLCLPEPGGYRVCVQRRGDDGATFLRGEFLALPVDASGEDLWVSTDGNAAQWHGRRSDRELSISFSAEGSEEEGLLGPSTLLRISESVSAPQWIDWDGDGDLDLMAQTRSQLHVWRQEPRGSFDGVRCETWSLPVEADQARRLDASYSSHALDLDADRRADCVIFAGDQRSDDVRTQMLAFVQGRGQPQGQPLFGERGRPQSLLVLAGFVSEASFDDVDGNGLVDVVVRTVRPDLIDQLRSVSSESLEADLYVYLNEGGRIGRSPALSHRYNVPIGKRFTISTRFFGDVTGDGLSELLQRNAPDTVALYMVRRQGKGLTVFDRPIWTLGVDREAQLVTVPVEGRRLPDLLVVEPAQVLHVRMR